MTDKELHGFYLELVARLQARGILCAITSGLACVHFQLAETTKDCDLLCHPQNFSLLLDELGAQQVGGLPCAYRGNLSPPLDERWHRGGWTSHFNWGRGPGAVTLDVFGRALRGSGPWEGEVSGLYISPHIVAQMKRTNRDKDWPFITLLGTRLVKMGDQRGWLHIFSEDTLAELLRDFSCPAELLARRPALRLAVERDQRVRAALLAERLLWERLDALRISIYERALRPYLVAVRRARMPDGMPLAESHPIRLQCAEVHLAVSPLRDYGIERLIEAARHEAIHKSGLIAEATLWLPDVRENFAYLN